jgi:hypothetical protein
MCGQPFSDPTAYIRARTLMMGNTAHLKISISSKSSRNRWVLVLQYFSDIPINSHFFIALLKTSNSISGRSFRGHLRKGLSAKCAQCRSLKKPGHLFFFQAKNA